MRGRYIYNSFYEKEFGFRDGHADDHVFVFLVAAKVKVREVICCLACFVTATYNIH
jgi:hypothetical protein